MNLFIEGSDANGWRRIENLLTDSKEKYKDTIDDLINTDELKIGDIIKIYGFYKVLDGGGHYRIISGSDNGSGVQIANGLYANIFHQGYVNAKWFGAISKNETDWRGTELQRFFNYIVAGKAKVFDIGDKDIYSNTSNAIIFKNNGRGFTLRSSGGKLLYRLADKKPCLEIGVRSNEYASLSEVMIRDFQIDGHGKQSDVLKLSTKGASDLAFWNSKFINLRISGDHGKGLGIYNGIFECQFAGIRIDMMRKYQETGGNEITNQDVGLYLRNEDKENIISSLYFNFVNIWGGWHNVKTESINTFAPNFSCNECHVFDSKREGLYLDNQNKGNYIKRLHMEFQGEEDHPVYGCFWNGHGVINLVEGGSDHMLGFVKTYNIYDRPLKIVNVSKPYNMPLKQGLIHVYPKGNSIIRTNLEYKELAIDPNASGILECLINGNPAKIKINNSNDLEMAFFSDKKSIYTSNEGVPDRINHIQIGHSGISGGQTDQEIMDFSPSSSIIKWQNGEGIQEDVKIGFYGSDAIKKPSIDGSKDGNQALTHLIAALSDLGLIKDNTTS